MRHELTELQRETDESTTTAEAFGTPLSEMDRPGRQKISRDRAEVNTTINQLDMIHVCRLFPPATAEYTFSSSDGTFTKRDHILGHKTQLTT